MSVKGVRYVGVHILPNNNNNNNNIIFISHWHAAMIQASYSSRLSRRTALGLYWICTDYLYSALFRIQSAQAWITQFYLQITPCLPFFVSVHQMALPVTEAADIWLQLTTHLSTPKEKVWKAELAWLVDLYRMVYPHEWSPISYRLRAGQRTFAGQRPTFYRWAMHPLFIHFRGLLPRDGILPGAKLTLCPKYCVLLYCQRYCRALEQQASAKICGVVQGMELQNFRRGLHLYSAGRWSRCSQPTF